MLHVSKSDARGSVAKGLPGQTGPPGAGATKRASEVPTLAELLQRKDYVGAYTLLLFERAHAATFLNGLWLAYCYFHAGEYAKASEVYKSLLSGGGGPACSLPSEREWECHAGLACCGYYMGDYVLAAKEAQACTASAQKSKEGAVDGGLPNRVLLCMSHKSTEKVPCADTASCEKALTESIQDQLCLAAARFMESRYDDAARIYKALLKEHTENVALALYVALCLYELDFYDHSYSFLQKYLQRHADSAVTLNLKAANFYRMYNGKAAEAEIQPLLESIRQSSAGGAATGPSCYGSDLVKHNLVVFRYGEGALQVLPPLVGGVPEAALNLVIFHLRNGDWGKAFELVSQQPEPSTPVEFMVRGMARLMLGQTQDGAEQLVAAAVEDLLHVGESPSECDTIPGRQCMSAVQFARAKWDELLLYLDSMRQYVPADDTFCWNFAVAKAMNGSFEEALRYLDQISSPHLKSEYGYVAVMAHCNIMCGRPRLAWESYRSAEKTADMFALLVLIANDCYRMASFYYAALAFDVLFRLYGNPEYAAGLRGSCAGLFQQIVAGVEAQQSVSLVYALLSRARQPECAAMLSGVRKWAQSRDLPVEVEDD